MKNFSIALGKEKSKINLWRRQKPKNSYTNFLPSKGFHQSSVLLRKINDSRSNILFNFVKKNFCEKKKIISEKINNQSGTYLIKTTQINIDKTSLTYTFPPASSSNTSELSLENQITKNKIEHMNKILPLGDNIVDDAIKYKIFTDSTPTAIDKLKEDVPEITGHLEFRDWVNQVIAQDKQEEVFKSKGILILKTRLDPFYKLNVDLHHYRKFHDRHYEVDIEEILTKDLFEKQRVVDTFVEENKENINNLIGYYNNRFKHIKYNKFNYLIYQNNYLDKMNQIKLKFLANISCVSLASLILYTLNPYLMLFMIPEYLATIFLSHLLNNLVDQIVLCDNKQSIVFRTFNFLGFRKEFPKKTHEILNISYYEKVINRVLNLSDKGWFFTTRLIRRFFRKKAVSSEKSSSNFDLDDFKTFHVIRSNFKFLYLPADLTKQHLDTNEELILNIINKNVKFVQEFDYTNYEDRVNNLKDALEEYKKEFAKKSHKMYVTDKERLQEIYSNMAGNRDFSDNLTEYTLKRSDGLDGTYINNGYR